MTERRLTLRMHQQMSGGRHDGRPWPPPGEPFEVPAWEFADLIRGGMAAPHGRDSESAAKDLDLGEHASPGHPSKLDPRPVTQIEAEAEGAGERAEADEEGRRRSAQIRSADRESAEAYAGDGIMGAPGSEVPDLYDGDEAQYPAAEGVRPDSQIEAEAGAYEARDAGAEGAARGRRASRKPGTAAQDEGEPAAEAAGDSGPEHVTAPVVVDAPAPDGAPSPSSPKQEWVDYAVSQGADVHAASGMTKVDLMSRYGGRL